LSIKIPGPVHMPKMMTNHAEGLRKNYNGRACSTLSKFKLKTNGRLPGEEIGGGGTNGGGGENGGDPGQG
jgi:hypothetical protein